MFHHEFPIFTTHPDLVYLDSASSAHKPKAVIDSILHFFANDYANIHRWSYDLSMESSRLYDRSKSAVATKLGASSAEIVFTYNATYAFNLIAQSLVKSGFLTKGDTVLLSKVEHHANIVPWQIIAAEYGIIIDWVELHSDGTLDYNSLEHKLPNAKILSITGASNVTGEILDLEMVKGIFDLLEQKPLLILDGSQRFPHMETDVVKYGIDFFVATGHKVMSDTGIGFYYGRKDLLQKMDPAFCGGGAINSVTTEWYDPAGLPFRHEPGTPHIAGAVSLLAALDYIDSIGGFAIIEQYEKELTEYALELFSTLPPSIRLVGSKKSENRLGVFSFVFDTHHPHDIAEILADAGICVRAGHHCTDVFHTALGIWGSLRASLYLYNTREDIDKLVEKLKTL